MQIQYYKAAWGDIKNSPGWFGKLCLLALLNFIPVFGQIVTFAYLYGWAREIAWGTHEPMPDKVFANEDGKFWRRGWFVLVLTLVFSLVPAIVYGIGGTMQSAGIVQSGYSSGAVQNPVLASVGGLISFIGWFGAIVAAVLAWVGSMRISIYDRLSAGFQMGKIWKMAKYDPKGLLKIFGMYLLVSIIVGLVLGFIISILVFVVAATGLAGLVGAGYSYETIQHMTDAQAMRLIAQFIASAGIVGVLAMLVSVFLSVLATVFLDMLVARAVGYWTMQFNVPRWGGQDEPLPFERADAAPAQANYNAAAPVVGASGQAPDAANWSPYNPYAAPPEPVASTTGMMSQPVVGQVGVMPQAAEVQPGDAPLDFADRAAQLDGTMADQPSEGAQPFAEQPSADVQPLAEQPSDGAQSLADELGLTSEPLADDSAGSSADDK